MFFNEENAQELARPEFWLAQSFTYSKWESMTGEDIRSNSSWSSDLKMSRSNVKVKKNKHLKSIEQRNVNILSQHHSFVCRQCLSSKNASQATHRMGQNTAIGQLKKMDQFYKLSSSSSLTNPTASPGSLLNPLWKAECGKWWEHYHFLKRTAPWVHC